VFGALRYSYSRRRSSALKKRLASVREREISTSAGIDGARSALHELATPHRVDDDHLLFGYIFQCFTARRGVVKAQAS
jgi:hypothetical protein